MKYEEINIQIVAGNSSLNYLIGNNLKLRDLNLGSAIINPNSIVSDLNYTYPERNWLLLPFYDPDRKFIGNRYTYEKNSSGRYELKYGYDGNNLSIMLFYYEGSLYNLEEWWLRYNNYRPQPFLCFIIDKVMEALGYTSSNQIAEHQIYKNAYIVHSQDTLQFAKMLPNWTVEKFFEEIEKLFDCTVVVDNNTMSAQILLNSKYYENATIVNAIALDDYEAETEDNSDLMSYEMNIGYNLPDTAYYNYQNLHDEWFNRMQHVVVNKPTDREKIAEIARLICLEPSSRKDNYSNTTMRSAYFDFIDYYEEGKSYLFPKVVNDYKQWIKHYDSEEMDRTLDIIPAEFAVIKYMIRERMDLSSKKYMMLQVPVARCTEEPIFVVSNEETNAHYPFVQNFIEGNESETINEDGSGSYTQMSIAFYKGDKWGLSEGEAVGAEFDPMPLSFVRGISERIYEPGKDFVYILERNGDYINPLSLNVLYNELYVNSPKVDMSKVYKIKFYSLKKPDARNLFVINNKLFYCRKIETIVTSDGINEIYEGEFYASGE